ncbi:TadE-like protein [Corynebacterium sp. TA-R-1]|uniref:TadE-like protein n=1 Tax=Corynebacterium stercoris TaxID=2943490 RepID=A0ABT1G3B4_9CORY|nr:TadE-like protein [Corynebacterium stercoris]
MSWLRARRALLADESGSASVTAAGIIAAVAALAFAVVAVVAGVAAQHRVAVAADLAAVSGASAYFSGADACGTAVHTASLNGADIERCEVVEGDVIVTAAKGRARASARAGPVASADSVPR